MSSHRVAGAPLDFAELRTELEVPGDFDSAAQSEAEQAAQAGRAGQSGAANPSGSPEASQYADATDLPFVTIDPPGSRDLDQAMYLQRDGSGYVVHYAIADVAAFVAPGSALDAAVRTRGETFYFPDARVPLHPTVLSEGAASLLPGQVCPAALWRIALDGTGNVAEVHVERAHVQSRAQLDYPGVQSELDNGHADESLTLLPEIGRLRTSLARARHAIDLALPEQDVVRSGANWTLEIRSPLPVERYNAEISVLTGMCAAQLMLGGKVGIVRTVPVPHGQVIDRLHRVAQTLSVDWPHGAFPGDVLAALDPGNPKHVAFLEHAASLLRGAAYTAFDGSPPADADHAGIGAPYAHVTAPLRRLVDRFGTEVCLALCAGRPVPQWARDALPSLPPIMERADQLAHTVDRAVVDMTEAWLLQTRVGETFEATVMEADDKAGTVLLDEPPVRARCEGQRLPVGERITARLIAADVATRTVRFTRA